MKQYVFDYANDIINSNKEDILMRDDMRKKIEGYIEAVLDDYMLDLITTDEALYQMSRPDKF